MERKRFDSLVVGLALGLLLLAGLWALLWPQGDFSESERRYLNAAPGTPNLSRWKTDRETESYLSDRVPFRSLLVGTDAAAQVLTGRRTQLSAWPVAGSLIEPPVEGDPADAEKRLSRFQKLADRAGADWFLLVPPTHGSLLRPSMNPLMRRLYEPEDELTGVLDRDPHRIPLADAFAAETDVFYRTDHHWTLKGARIAYEHYCAAAGLEAAPPDSFVCSEYPGFRGTTAGRSGLNPGMTDVLECASPAVPVTLTIRETGEQYSRLIFPEQAAGWDGYAVYLNGNHGMLEISNPAAPEGTLLVFRDSFGSCLLPMLCMNYRSVVAVDARYYDGSFSDAVDEVRPDALLFCYSLDSVVNDTVLLRKAR